MEPFLAPDGYDRSKHPRMLRVRPMTPKEALALTYGSHPDILALDGKVRTVKVIGKVRTWKRDPNRIEIPCKYGMYECATFEARDGMMISSGGAFLLVRVQEEGASDEA